MFSLLLAQAPEQSTSKVIGDLLSSPLTFFLIIVFFVILAIRSNQKNTKKREDGSVPDSEHGFTWKLCRWKVLVTLILLCSLLSGFMDKQYFVLIFFCTLILILSIFFLTILLPSIIRLISNKQHSIFISGLVTVLSWIIGIATPFGIIAHLSGEKSGGASLMSTLFAVAAYKIMRSEAGFSSVFWKRKKKPSPTPHTLAPKEQQAPLNLDPRPALPSLPLLKEQAALEQEQKPTLMPPLSPDKPPFIPRLPQANISDISPENKELPLSPPSPKDNFGEPPVVKKREIPFLSLILFYSSSLFLG